MELVRVKFANPVRKVRKHLPDGCVGGCSCIEKKYIEDYNFSLESKSFELTNSDKKCSLLCKVDSKYYYCYNLNEMFNMGYLPVGLLFDGFCFSWRVDGVDGCYKSGLFFEVDLLV